ncbi:MAG TPA: DHA2 family efflux MFS transporter permease subunit [Patescibacteria group bacterium]|nr:DHA2 family efflux MFS transporter permease subunit [Patescibacteria group bacterium]
MAKKTSSEKKEEKSQGFTRDQWLILATVMISSFLGRLDGSIVNLALPKIISEFGITVSQASWIATAYIIANAIFVPVFGKLGDMIGRKRLYIWGILGFTFTSALAGLSFNFPSLIFFRILQAITVSIDYPIALSIIAYNFTDRRLRAQAMGMWSAIFAAAIIFGPLIGGPLIDNFSWRSVFYVNVPLGIIGTLMAMRYVKETVKGTTHLKHFDFEGSILLGVSLGTMVLVLDQGQSWGWGSLNSIITYIVSTVSMIAFIWFEQHQREPIIDLKFFKDRVFTTSIITSFISFMGMIGGIFLIPLFVQTYLGYSVTKSGYVFIPMAIGMMMSAQIGGRMVGKIPGNYLTAVGMFWAAFIMFLFSGLDIKWSFWHISGLLFLLAAGLGAGLPALTQAATSSVPLEEVGQASSVLALARNIAGAFGTAIFATILTNNIYSQLFNIQHFSAVNTTNPTIIQTVVGLMEVKANIAAYGTVFTVAAAFTFIGGIAALFVRDTKKTIGAKLLKEEQQPLEL